MPSLNGSGSVKLSVSMPLTLWNLAHAVSEDTQSPSEIVQRALREYVIAREQNIDRAQLLDSIMRGW